MDRLGSSFWGLPGPDRFLQTLGSDLRDGRNVVVLLPVNGPSRLARALTAHLAEVKTWIRVPPPPPDERPVEYVYRTVLPGHGQRGLRTPSRLAQESGLWGQVLAIEIVLEQNWLAWREFLEDYANAIRAQDQTDRATFCVILRGIERGASPQDDVCLAVRPWDGIASHLDMLLFAARLVGQRHGSPLLERLASEIVARLSMWDPELALTLAELPLIDLFRPREALREFGRRRGWNGHRERLGCAWSKGAAHRFEEEARTHSASLAMDDSEREIDRRLWTAQVSVLYPYLEEQRRKLLERHRMRFGVPFTGRLGETITDYWDLEFTHIEQQLSMGRWSGADALREKVLHLRRARNQLAHLEPLDYDLIQDPLFLM